VVEGSFDMKLGPELCMHLFRNKASLLMFLPLFILLSATAANAEGLTELESERIQQALPTVNNISGPQGQYAVRELFQDNTLLGYAFQTNNVAPIPAYSGKPINMQIILDTEANILDAYV